MTYDCRSVLKHVLKCYDIFPDVHNNREQCRGPVESSCRMRQKSYRVNRPLGSLSKDDSNGNENVSPKYNLALL